MRAMKAGSDRLIVALDGMGPEESLQLLGRLRDVVRICKVGPALFYTGGPDLLQRIGAAGFEVFLDLKFHDIPRTVHRSVEKLAGAPVRFLTVHALGGEAMLRAAVDGARAAARDRPPAVVAVTILTSLGATDLVKLGFGRRLEAETIGLATLARDAGVAGVVCSGHEAATIRNACGDRFLILTPGIRSAADPAGDQVRTVTAGDAIRSGADFIVVGRPILDAIDPVAAAARLAAEIAAARGSRKPQ
jgi:orotidine-5'-phosphate decarboxylase